MDKIRQQAQKPQFLCGWKEIASYLGKGVRTVQRYERYMGLPIRRPAARSSGAVVATKAELDAWIGASPVREVWQLTKREALPTIELDKIKENVGRMVQLRDQMQMLRMDLQLSLDGLHRTLCGLQSMFLGPNFDNRAGRHSITMLSDDERSNHVLDLLALDPRRKAS